MRFLPPRLFSLPFFLLGPLVTLFPPILLAQAEDASRLARDLQPILTCLSGEQATFTLTAQSSVQIDGETQEVTVRLRRYSDDAFDFDATHQDYAVGVHRRGDATAMLLPLHKTVFFGQGQSDPTNHLSPQGISNRLLSPASKLATLAPILQSGEARSVALLLVSLLDVNWEPTTKSWSFGDKASLKFSDQGQTLDVKVDEHRVRLSLTPLDTKAQPLGDWPETRVVDLDRSELERQLVRGVRRASEILAPGKSLTSPPRIAKKVDHGELRWVQGHRVALLGGTPEQIGKAHGELLKQEALRCIDSVLCTFGTVQTIRTGRWFRHDLEDAYARLEPHIPERHQAETRAMAASLGIDQGVAQALNVFPELFHCSGFAVYGDATVEGKLYHGRVLDYMTTIGLQDAATTFVIAPQGRHAFANVGYASFIGSVTGMNSRGISLGEMGGGGEGQWDGVPMATLMRRALEECSTLDEVTSLWSNSPRTCEYFYVFADGKTNQTVGVAATPDHFELVQPGADHELLGPGIQDAVVLSSGSRLETLRQRVKERYGQIDVETAQWLMSRPVAMRSNLHNVLFVPEDGVLYVANATHDHPAAEQPYVRLDLKELLKQWPMAQTSSQRGDRVFDGATFPASDTLAPGTDVSPDAQACLEGLTWEQAEFQVRVEASGEWHGDWIVQFPSPVRSGNPVNDTVTLEWYVAQDENNTPIVAPAVVVVHESGSGMKVGRMFAQGLRLQGLHALMIHLPHYGQRRREGESLRGENLIPTIRQAVADVRRGRDAVASLPWIDSENISLQGTSLGGFVTATAASLDGGYDQVFIMLAGGDLLDVIENGHRETAEFRDELQAAGLTGQTLKSAVATIEPLRIAHRLDPASTWLYSAMFDKVVPPVNSHRLARVARLDPSHHHQLLANHYTGVIYIPFLLGHIQQQVQSGVLSKNSGEPSGR